MAALVPILVPLSGAQYNHVVMQRHDADCTRGRQGGHTVPPMHSRPGTAVERYLASLLPPATGWLLVHSAQLGATVANNEHTRPSSSLCCR
jgi:hypothetical protein